jgi:hypothetical protein
MSAITTIPSALLGVIRLGITNTITNISRIIYRTIGIASDVAIGAKIAITTAHAITTIPFTLLRVIRLGITNTITNRFRKKYRTIGIMEGAIETNIAIIAAHAITTIPSTLLRVAYDILATICRAHASIPDITIVITNIFRKSYRTIGIIEVAVGANIATRTAIATITSALHHVVLVITQTITNCK